MDRWILEMEGGRWAYADADGTGRVFGPGGFAEDISEQIHSKLFARARKEGKRCTGPDESIKVHWDYSAGVKQRRKLTL